MENKIYITIQVYFKNMHFNKKDKFILEKLIKIKHSQHQYAALGEVKKAYLLKTTKYFLSKKGEIHLWKIPLCRALGHALTFSFHWSKINLPDTTKTLPNNAQRKFIFALVDFFFQLCHFKIPKCLY